MIPLWHFVEQPFPHPTSEVAGHVAVASVVVAVAITIKVTITIAIT